MTYNGYLTEWYVDDISVLASGSPPFFSTVTQQIWTPLPGKWDLKKIWAGTEDYHPRYAPGWEMESITPALISGNI